MQYNYAGDVAGLSGAVTASSPRWLRLTRVGNAITGFDSLDGTDWTKIGTISLRGLARTVQVGLLVTSPFDYNKGSATLSTATFDQVNPVGDFPAQLEQPYRRSKHPELRVWTPRGNWFTHSDGTFTISGSGDIAPQVQGGRLLSQGEREALLLAEPSGSSRSIVLRPCSSALSTGAVLFAPPIPPAPAEFGSFSPKRW